jgi:predicted ATPase/DNA-binding SARP family transcriptional activator
MHRLRIHTLGDLQVFLDGELVDSFDTDKVRALLAFLSVEASRSHRRSYLAGLFWSDQPEEHALHSLRQALSGLRKALGEKKSQSEEYDQIRLILVVRDTLRLNPEVPIWLDFKIFEERLSQAYEHYQRANGRGRLNFRRLKQAIDLYQGPFLDQFYLSGSPLFDEWAMMQREYINQRMMEALSYLARYQEMRGENMLAVQTAQRLAQLAPWEEAACLQIVHLLAVEGYWSAALAQAQKFIRFITAELGLEPAQEMMDLIEKVRKHAYQLSTPDKTNHPLLFNLPAMDTTFIGREREQDQLADLLSDPCCRLITINGMGGIGKTRLAVQAAEEQVGIFNDGVFFVHFSTSLDTTEFMTSLAGAVNFKFFDNRPPREQLIHYFQTKDLLLILDSFEHLLAFIPEENEIIPFLLEILNGSERIKILVTSRLPLNLKMEQVVEVSGLDFPPEIHHDPLQTYSAVELFRQTARRMQPQFSLEVEQQSVYQICRILEGVPLAIELSAAWVRLQSCTEILKEIRLDLDYLSTSMQDVPSRHRSLRVVFDHSWKLLSFDEQEAFMRLSVFRDGFTLESASTVASADPQLVANLGKASLLQHINPNRYDLHNLVQRFAAEKLAKDESAAWETSQRFAHYYAGFLARQVPLLKNAGQQQALEQMAQERGNWRQAWGWLNEQYCVSEIGQCAEAVFHYYNIRSSFQEGMELLQQASAWLEAGTQNKPVLARVWTFLGALAYRAHYDELSYTVLQRAVTVLEERGDLPDLALALVFWAGINARKKEHTLAKQAAERSAALHRQAGDVWGEGYALYLLGLLYNRQGMNQESYAAEQASLAAARQSGDLHRQIGPLNLLGDILCSQGDYDLAQGYFEESLRISRSIQDRYNSALVSLNLGTVYHLREQFEDASRLYQESLEICKDIGDTAGQATALSNLGELASDQGESYAALPYFLQGLALSRLQQDDWAELSCLNNLANAYLELNDLSSAQIHIKAALPLCLTLNSPPLSSITLLQLAKLKLKQGDQSGSAELLAVILKVEGLDLDTRQKIMQICKTAHLDLPVETISLARALAAAARFVQE